MRKIYYNSEEERNSIERNASNKNWVLVEDAITSDGGYLVFDTNVEKRIEYIKKDMNDVAELTTMTALDKDELAEMLVYALQKIDELEARVDG